MDLESEKAQLTPPQSAVRPSESHHCADLQNGLPGRACAADSSRSECLLGTFPNANLIRKRQEGESKRVHTDPQGGNGGPKTDPGGPVPVLPPGLLRSGRHRGLLVGNPSPKTISSCLQAPCSL